MTDERNAATERPIAEVHIPPTSVQALAKLTNEGNDIFPQVLALKVEDQTTLDIMTAHMGGIKQWLAGIDGYFDPIEEAISASLKIAKAQHGAAKLPGLVAQQYAARSVDAFLTEQETKRVERERLERLAQEQKDQAARTKHVAKLEAKGASEDDIAAVERAPMPPVSPIAAPQIEKPKGLVQRKNYSANCKSTGMAAKIFNAKVSTPEADCVVALLVAFGLKGAQIRAQKHLLQYLEPNKTALNSTAKSSKEQFSVPGAELFIGSSTHVRS